MIKGGGEEEGEGEGREGEKGSEGGGDGDRKIDKGLLKDRDLSEMGWKFTQKFTPHWCHIVTTLSLHRHHIGTTLVPH